MKKKIEVYLKCIKIPNLQDKVRKSLHTLQPAATDKENLVGGGRTLRSSVLLKETIKEVIKE